MSQQFEGNSFKSRQEHAPQSPTKLDSVVSEKPIVNKKKWRFIDCFYDSSEKSFGDFFMQDLLIPNMKKALGAAFHGVISKLFGVGFGPSSPYKFSNGWYGGWRDDGYIEYSARNGTQQSSQKIKQPQASTNLESYALRSRDDAEKVLEGLDAYLETYDAVPVSAFFELIGVTAPYTYNDFGWTNLASAKVIQVENGYSIRFPKPIRIR